MYLSSFKERQKSNKIKVSVLLSVCYYKAHVKQTRPDTRLPYLRAGGQGQRKKLSVIDRWTDRQTERVVELRARDYKELGVLMSRRQFTNRQTDRQTER